MTKIRNEKLLKAFGDKIRSLRAEKNLSQYKMADIANIERSQVIGIEKGEINTTISTLFALAKALDIEPKELLDLNI